MHLIEPHVPLGCERDDRLPGLLIYDIDRHPPPIARHHCRDSPLLIGGEQPSRLPR